MKRKEERAEVLKSAGVRGPLPRIHAASLLCYSISNARDGYAGKVEVVQELMVKKQASQRLFVR